MFKQIIIYREPPPKAGRSARYAALAFTILAGLGLIGGITDIVVAGNLKNRIDAVPQIGDIKMTCPSQPATAQCSLYQISLDSYNSSAFSSLLGFGTFVLGGAGAIGLYFYGRRLDQRQERELAKKQEVSLWPLGLRGGGGLAIGGRF